MGIQPTRIVDPGGIRSGFNNSGSAIGANLVVIRAATADKAIALPAAVDNVLAGVTMAAIANGDYGDVQVAGKAVCVAGGSFSRGARLMCTTAGKVVTYVAAEGINVVLVGIAEQDGALDELVEVELRLDSRQGSA
jgi:hypothetical protein